MTSGGSFDGRETHKGGKKKKGPSKKRGEKGSSLTRGGKRGGTI